MYAYELEGAGDGSVWVLLLDTDLPENSEEDCALTNDLYGGDARYRLMQEAVLGIGGVRMLRALGCTSLERFHMNEGHAALLALELRRQMLRIERTLHASAALSRRILVSCPSWRVRCLAALRHDLQAIEVRFRGSGKDPEENLGAQMIVGLGMGGSGIGKFCLAAAAGRRCGFIGNERFRRSSDHADGFGR